MIPIQASTRRRAARPLTPPPTNTGPPQEWPDGASTQPPDLSHLIPAAKQGDETAFARLFLDLQPRLLRYLRTLVGDDAEDVAADVWIQVATKLPAFEGGSAGFRSWTATIARHRAIDHLRHQRRRATADIRIEELTEIADHEDPEELLLDRISTDEALALIAELPRDQAEAILLRVVIGLDAKETGRVLGKQPGAVRTAAYRGLRSLAEKLRARSPVREQFRPRPTPDPAPLTPQ